MNELMLLMDFESFCADSATIWKLVGWVFMVFKIVIPLLLIILGSIDLGKAVISGKSEDVSKNAKSLAMRAIAAICIFLVPSLVGIIINWISDLTNTDLDYEICSTCIVNPGNCDTSGVVTGE